MSSLSSSRTSDGLEVTIETRMCTCRSKRHESGCGSGGVRLPPPPRGDSGGAVLEVQTAVS